LIQFLWRFKWYFWKTDNRSSFLLVLFTSQNVNVSLTFSYINPLHCIRVIEHAGVTLTQRTCIGNRSTRRKPASAPLCPPQIPHDVGSNRGLRCKKPTTNRLSFGAALLSTVCFVSHAWLIL
jgi:hypothetical protein